jgi:hypothetical protein
MIYGGRAGQDQAVGMACGEEVVDVERIDDPPEAS